MLWREGLGKLTELKLVFSYIILTEEKYILTMFFVKHVYSYTNKKRMLRRNQEIFLNIELENYIFG